MHCKFEKSIKCSNSATSLSLFQSRSTILICFPPLLIFSEPCAAGDEVCDKERVEYESIAALHRQIDDDQSGAIDLSESDEVTIHFQIYDYCLSCL
jgi:hypothetical protein